MFSFNSCTRASSFSFRASFLPEDTLIVDVGEGRVVERLSGEHRVAEVIVAKQRNGPTGTLKLAFQDKYARFADLRIGVVFTGLKFFLVMPQLSRSMI